MIDDTLGSGQPISEETALQLASYESLASSLFDALSIGAGVFAYPTEPTLVSEHTDPLSPGLKRVSKATTFEVEALGVGALEVSLVRTDFVVGPNGGGYMAAEPVLSLRLGDDTLIFTDRDPGEDLVKAAITAVNDTLTESLRSELGKYRLTYNVGKATYELLNCKAVAENEILSALSMGYIYLGSGRFCDIGEENLGLEPNVRYLLGVLAAFNDMGSMPVQGRPGSLDVPTHLYAHVMGYRDAARMNDDPLVAAKANDLLKSIPNGQSIRDDLFGKMERLFSLD